MNTTVTPSFATRSVRSPEPLGIGFGVGRQPCHPFLAQAVARRQMAERLVAGDDDPPFAPLPRSLRVPRVQRRRGRRAVAAALRAYTARPFGIRVGELPLARVGRSPPYAPGRARCEGPSSPQRSNDTVGAVALLGGLLDRGLETVPEVEHHVGVEDLVDLVGGELEVVGLGARRREVRHLDAVAADALRGVGHRIEARDHRPAGRLGGGGHRTAEHERRDQGRDDRRAAT